MIMILAFNDFMIKYVYIHVHMYKMYNVAYMCAFQANILITAL